MLDAAAYASLPFAALVAALIFVMQVYLPHTSQWLWTRALIHREASVIALVAAFIGFIPALRWFLRKYGELTARFRPPTGLEPDEHSFPHREVDLLTEVERRPPGMLFVGLTPEKRRYLPGYTYRPVYLSEKDRSTHRHVLGRTGSGKTTSVLWPQVLQDALDGKGVVVIDAKGSDENIGTLKAIAQRCGREKDLRIFSLPAWNERSLFTHRYNLVWVPPGGNATAMAERVLSVLPLGDNVYFNTQARVAFTNLCRLLHGMVDEEGHRLPFNLEDLAVCLAGVGGDAKDPDGSAQALAWCLNTSIDQRASEALQGQLRRLGTRAHEVLSGLSGALESFMSPVINAYAPDLVFEDVLEQNCIAYVQLPTNLFKLQAPALGKAMLMDLQQSGSLRQVFRKERNQRPFSVVVDEFGSFADLSIIESLNKLRDANLNFTLSHQSLADLELVSKEFAQAVFDNCLTRDLLAQENPELCERLAKSLGTLQRQERTVQVGQGPLWTEVLTGAASSKLVDAYRLHPNAFKLLPRCGQGYLIGAAQVGQGRKAMFRNGWSGICYPRLPQELLDGADYVLERNDQSKARGLRLDERYVGRTKDSQRGNQPAPKPAAAGRSRPARPPREDLRPRARRKKDDPHSR